MLRGDHRPNGFAFHYTTERDRLRIRFPVIHPAAHVGVERQILDPKQNLSGARRRDCDFLKTKVAWLRAALRPGSKDDLAGFYFVHVGTSKASLSSCILRNLSAFVLCDQHDAKPCLALHHASVSISSLFERSCLDHRTDILQD